MEVPNQSTSRNVDFCLMFFLYILEYLFRVCSIFIVGTPKYEEEDVNKKIVIVTGANSGLGKATSYQLARRGATVVMAGRNATKLARAASDIRSRTGAGELVIIRMLIITKFCHSSQ